MNIPIIQFNGGEYSQKIECRVDTEKHRAGCRSLINMIPLVQGPVERRQGTRFIYNSTVPVRIIGGGDEGGPPV